MEWWMKWREHLESTTTEAPPTASGPSESKLRVTDVRCADGTSEVSVVDDNQKVLAYMHITSSGLHMTMDACFAQRAMNSSRFCRAVAETFLKMLESGDVYYGSSD